MTRRTTHALAPTGADRVVAALDAALAGGPAVAPLPDDKAAAARALAMLRPDLPLETDDLAAVVSTSGSTGEPKGVLLSRAAMVASIETTHARLGGPGRWLLALPLHYVAGLMAAARSLHAGHQPVDVGSDLHGLVDLPSAAVPSYLSIVPTQLVRALADPALTAALVGLDAVLVGGAASADGLLGRARAAGIRVTTTYGMSETCGGCVYDGHPLDDVVVDLEPSGRVVLGGPTVFSGYRLRPDLTAGVLRTLPSGARAVLTSDRGRFADGRLEVLGRLDDVIISGGTNVDLAAVERELRRRAEELRLADRGIAEVVVIGVDDPEWGTRVVAVAERPIPLAELIGPRSPLDRAARPKELIVVDPLPRTPNGKVDRPALRELAAGRTVSGS